MNKKIIQNTFSFIIIILSVFFIGITSAAAVNESIKETTSAIPEGSYVIGITRFSPGVLTIDDTVKAAFNYAAYSNSEFNPAPFKMYFYDFGSWYEIGATKTTKITDANLINQLNTVGVDVYYVDNVEKKFTINYDGSANVTFRTDKSNKDKEVTLSGNTITVPATVNELRVYGSNNSLVATYAKVNNGFTKNPHLGKIINSERDNDANLVSFSDNKTIIFQGNVPYKITKGADEANGNLIAVGVLLDQDVNNTVPNKSATRVIVYDAANPNGSESAWNTNDIFRKVDVLLSEEARSAVIEVVWEEGNSQYFTVALTDTSTLEEVPKGYIYSDGKTGKKDPDSEDENLYTDLSEMDVIKYNSDIAHYESYNGLKAGNRVGVEIVPNSKYVSSKNSVKVEVEGAVTGDDAVPTWGTSNGEDAIIYTPLVTEDNKEILIKVTWEEGYTQTFKIVVNGNLLTGK